MDRNVKNKIAKEGLITKKGRMKNGTRYISPS